MDKFTRNAFSLTLLAVGIIFGYTTKVAMDRIMTYADFYVKSTSLQVVINLVPVLVGAAAAYITYRIQKLKNYLLEVIAEVKKVVWPNKKETWGATVVVIIAVIISGIVLALFDWVSGLLMTFFLK